MFLVMMRVTSLRFSFSWSSCVAPCCCPFVNDLESLYSRVVLEMKVSVGQLWNRRAPF